MRIWKMILAGLGVSFLVSEHLSYNAHRLEFDRICDSNYVGHRPDLLHNQDFSNLIKQSGIAIFSVDYGGLNVCPLIDCEHFLLDSGFRYIFVSAPISTSFAVEEKGSRLERKIYKNVAPFHIITTYSDKSTCRGSVRRVFHSYNAGKPIYKELCAIPISYVPKNLFRIYYYFAENPLPATPGVRRGIIYKIFAPDYDLIGSINDSYYCCFGIALKIKSIWAALATEGVFSDDSIQCIAGFKERAGSRLALKYIVESLTGNNND